MTTPSHRGIVPARRLDSVLQLTPEMLAPYQALLLDYDNTLAPWHHELSAETRTWLKALPCPAYVLSNGHGHRVRDALEGTGVKVRGDCFKPFTHRIRRLLQDEGLDPTRCLFVGDNSMTDIWTGNRLGCATLRVRPIVPREHPLTCFWRFLERVFDPDSRQ